MMGIASLFHFGGVFWGGGATLPSITIVYCQLALAQMTLPPPQK